MRFTTDVEEIKKLNKPVKLRNGSREAVRIAKRNQTTVVLLRGRSWAILTGEPNWKSLTTLGSYQANKIVDMLWCLVDLGLLSRLSVEQHERDAALAKEISEREGDIKYARKLVKAHGYKVIKKPKRKKPAEGGAN